MQTHQKNTRSFRGNAALLASVFLLNLTFASLALAAAEIEWIPATGVVTADSLGEGSSESVQRHTRVIEDGSGNYIAAWTQINTGFTSNILYAQKFDANGNALWSPATGVPLRDDSGCVDEINLISDGSDGAIILWHDYCFPHEISGLGINGTDGSIAPGWTTNGTLLIDATSFVEMYDVVPDGSGGGIMLYQPYANLSVSAVRIQRFNSTGVNQWNGGGTGQTSGTALTTQSPHLRAGYHMIKTSDGVIASFNTTVSGSAKTIAQKVNMSGVNQWGATGVQLSTNTATKSLITSDGNDGAYVSFVTNDGGGAFRNRITHIDSDGNLVAGCSAGGDPLSGANPNVNQVTAEVFDLATSSSNSALIALKTGSSSMLVQEILDDCSENYSVSPVHTAVTSLNEVGVSSDNNGGAYVVWADTINNKTQRLMAQRVDSTGVSRFGDGLTSDLIVTDRIGYNSYLEPADDSNDDDFHENPWGNMPFATGTSGFVIAWNNTNIDFSNFAATYGDNYAHRVVDTTPSTTGDETEPWNVQGIPIQQTGINVGVNQVLKDSVRTSEGGYVVAWTDYKDRFPAIYAEKYDINGIPQWNTAEPGVGILISGTPISDEGSEVDLDTDNSGNTLFIYTSIDGVHVQKVDTNGNNIWGTNGVIIDSSTHVHGPKILHDGSGGAFVVRQIIGTEGDGITLGKIRSDNGNLDTGFASAFIEEASCGAGNCAIGEELFIVRDNFGGVILAYADYNPTGPVYQIFAWRYDSTGSLSTSWGTNPMTLANESSTLILYDAISDGTGGIITGYSVGDTPDINIEAQRVTGNGFISTGWPATITNATGDQPYSRLSMVSDNATPANGAIFTWDDYRSGAGVTIETYALRLDANGQLVSGWTLGGNQISSTDATFQDNPRIVSNGGNGAIITYFSHDALLDGNIFAQHLNGSGVPQWGVNGEQVETNTPYAQGSYTPVSDNYGGVVIPFLHTISSLSDVKTQYVSDTLGPICVEAGVESFCGQQQISSASLTFTSIPDSFAFPQISSSGTTQNLFTNGVANPPLISGDDHDLLTVLDTRGDPIDGGLGGGFTVQVNNSTTFTDGVNVIPISNLFITTATDNSSIAGTVPIGGVMYEDVATIPAGTRNITSPVDAGDIGTTITLSDLEATSTFTNIFPGLPNPGSQFGNGDIVLMDGTLPATAGRNGSMHQFINYYLTLPPANQATGNYQVILTFTLFDSTT